jgi:glycolate oxidase
MAAVTPDPPQVLAALARTFPADRLLTHAGALAPYESDGLTTYRGRPRAVVLAETQDEVIAAVRCCHDAGVPFMARGSGTSLSGGAVPVDDGIVIALNRVNRIVRLDPSARIAVVEPGVVNLDVTGAAAPHGLYYAPDPSSQSICTIGGNVAFNSGGAHCFRHGMTANHVLGIKAVLPDGAVVQLGGDSIEHVGPDLVGMFVGSEGLFGIALEITLRLVPRPEAYQTLLAAYSALQGAGDAVSRIIAEGLLPGAMEIMDRLAIDAAEAAVDAGYPRGAAAILIVELEGDRAEVDAEFTRLMSVIEASGATAVRVATDAADRARIWKGRKCAFSAVGRISPDFIVQDGVVPRTRLGDALARIELLSTAHGLRVANVFHAGDGNLHPLILFDGREDGALDRAERLAADILRLCIELGGSITGEHGVGLEKRGFLGEMYAADDVAFMRRLHTSIDPGELANRGKMLGASTKPQGGHGLHPLERTGVISRV